MGTSKHPGKKSHYTLKPAIGAFIDLNFAPGFAALPDLIGKDSVEKSIIQLRQTYYYAALSVITKEEWNHYIHLGFQQFADPLDYLKCVDLETIEESDIRLFHTSVFIKKKPMKKSIRTSTVLLVSSGTSFLKIVRLRLS